MKTSVLIIAHNEEAHIRECIESLLNQSQKADEIVLVVHNSTDKTKEIAETYPIIVVPLSGPAGIPYARIKGLSHVTGEIVLCIDGDSYANKNWVAEMSAMLGRGNILVGSLIKMKGTAFGQMLDIVDTLFCTSKGKKAVMWVWGGSMGFWAKDKEKVQNILRESIVLTEKLKLPYNPDDLWLAKFLNEEGSLEVTNKTWVTTYTKEKTSFELMVRGFKNTSGLQKVSSYFKNRSALKQ